MRTCELFHVHSGPGLIIISSNEAGRDMTAAEQTTSLKLRRRGNDGRPSVEERIVWLAGLLRRPSMRDRDSIFVPFRRLRLCTHHFAPMC